MPLSEKDVRNLKLGDTVLLNGTVFTARDAAHKYLTGNPDPAKLPDLHGAVLYHCGPVVVRTEHGWKVTAAGPTTSIREEPYEDMVIKKYGIRAVIGKGGMKEKTASACRECGCVYLHAVGGAAQILASSVRKVSNVFMMDEFGAPEAIWQFEVMNFPAIVTMDCSGASLHADILQKSQETYSRLLSGK